MSEEQVLPELIATLKAAAEKATQGQWIDAYTSVLTSNNNEIVVAQEFWKHPHPHCRTQEDIAADIHYIAQASPENIIKLLASLAQSEAERERLQGELSAAEAGWTKQSALHGVTKFELARERELHQGLREVVKEYRNQKTLIPHGAYCSPNPCSTCIKADALLEDKSKPVATTS